MLRKHENPDSFKAGMYALAVHVILLVGMLVSFNWKAAHPVLNVTEVELWDKLPAPKTADVPKPEPKPVMEEKPEPKVEPKPEPKLEEKPKPEEPKVDIELEKKKKELELKKEKELTEKIKKDEDRKKLAQQMREEDLQEKTTEKQAKADKDKALRKLKEDMLNETGADDSKATSAANATLIGEYTEKIKAKIRGNIISGLCGDGNPVIKVSVDILPTGQLRSGVKITKSSGNTTCDDAVERAILMSEPFQLPDDAKLKAEFRDLNLTISPNR